MKSAALCSCCKQTIEFVSNIVSVKLFRCSELEAAVWVLYFMRLWSSDRCQNVNVYTVRLWFRFYSKHDNIIKISLLCSDVFLFPYEKKQLLWPRAFVCVYIFVWDWMNGWDLPRGLIHFLLLSHLKRWNLRRPVFENSPQPQAGGLWQSHPTAAGDAALAGSHHLCQWRRHTVRSTVHSGFIHVAQACWWLAMLRSLISRVAAPEDRLEAQI